MVTWNAQLLRMTSFPQSITVDVSTITDSWFTDIVGIPPDSVNHQPKHRRLVVVSAYELGQLLLQIEADRLDWVYVAQNPADMSSAPQLGALSAALDSFVPIVEKWFSLDNCPNSMRLAFGAFLESPASSKADAYRQLAYMIGNWVKLDPENSSDFLYQINRPRSIISEGGEIRVNRLSKWSAALYQSIVLIPEAGASRTTTGVGSRLELDINTAPEFGHVLPGKTQLQIFRELLSLGKEIAEKGDIP